MMTMNPATQQLRLVEEDCIPRTPELENDLQQWLRTGRFPHPELQLRANLLPQAQSTGDLRLILQLSFAARTLQLEGWTQMAILAPYIPRYLIDLHAISTAIIDTAASCLRMACTHSCVMQALLSLSARRLSWLLDSPELHELSLKHRGMALQALRISLMNIDPANASPVFATNWLLLRQADDIYTWSVLRKGMAVLKRAPVGTTQSTMDSASSHLRPRSHWLFDSERPLLSQRLRMALNSLCDSMRGHEPEHHWSTRLQVLVHNLLTMTADEAMSVPCGHLRGLVDWTLFLPGVLFTKCPNKCRAVLVVSYLYAMTLVIWLLFPDLDGATCGLDSYRPLQEILHALPKIVREHAKYIDLQNFTSLIEFPRQALATFRERVYAAETRKPEDKFLYLNRSYETLPGTDM